MIYHLLYISEQTEEFTDLQLEKLLEKSQFNNSKRDLTGVLIKNGKFFLQLLEGNEQQVNQLLKIISADPRHQRIRSLMTFSDDTRMFPKWSMGYVTESQHPEKMAELIPLIHADALKKVNVKDRILSVLKKFNH